jgi:hypothetical protein
MLSYVLCILELLEHLFLILSAKIAYLCSGFAIISGFLSLIWSPRVSYKALKLLCIAVWYPGRIFNQESIIPTVMWEQNFSMIIGRKSLWNFMMSRRLNLRIIYQKNDEKRWKWMFIIYWIKSNKRFIFMFYK